MLSSNFRNYVFSVSHTGTSHVSRCSQSTGLSLAQNSPWGGDAGLSHRHTVLFTRSWIRALHRMWEVCLHIPLLPVGFEPTHIPGSQRKIPNHTSVCWLKDGISQFAWQFKDLEEERNREKENTCVYVCVCVWCVPIKSTICLTDNIYHLKHPSSSLTSSCLHIFSG